MNPKTLRIVFMGTPEFAVPSLRRLVAEGYNVVGAVTVPDKPAGRGRHLRESDVKIAARELGVPVLQPEKFRDPAFLDALQALQGGELLDAVTVLLDEAAQALMTLTGERVTEAVVEEVFRHFCVGK